MNLPIRSLNVAVCYICINTLLFECKHLFLVRRWHNVHQSWWNCSGVQSTFSTLSYFKAEKSSFFTRSLQCGHHCKFFIDSGRTGRSFAWNCHVKGKVMYSCWIKPFIDIQGLFWNFTLQTCRDPIGFITLVCMCSLYWSCVCTCADCFSACVCEWVGGCMPGCTCRYPIGVITLVHVQFVMELCL